MDPAGRSCCSSGRRVVLAALAMQQMCLVCPQGQALTLDLAQRLAEEWAMQMVLVNSLRVYLANYVFMVSFYVRSVFVLRLFYVERSTKRRTNVERSTKCRTNVEHCAVQQDRPAVSLNSNRPPDQRKWS